MVIINFYDKNRKTYKKSPIRSKKIWFKFQQKQVGHSKQFNDHLNLAFFTFFLSGDRGSLEFLLLELLPALVFL